MDYALINSRGGKTRLEKGGNTPIKAVEMEIEKYKSLPRVV